MGGDYCGRVRGEVFVYFKHEDEERDPNSLACSWTHFPRRRIERCRPPAAHACPEYGHATD